MFSIASSKLDTKRNHLLLLDTGCDVGEAVSVYLKFKFITVFHHLEWFAVVYTVQSSGS